MIKYLILLILMMIYFISILFTGSNATTIIAPIVSFIVVPIVVFFYKNRNVKFCYLFNSLALVNFVTILILYSQGSGNWNILGVLLLLPLTISIISVFF